MKSLNQSDGECEPRVPIGGKKHQSATSATQDSQQVILGPQVSKSSWIRQPSNVLEFKS
jgi:hypothetical protein